jgi:transcriptional regulator with XRE-family HTH domain
MNYGKAIKIARAAAGLQQKELAELASVDPSHISLIETGKRQPSVGTLEKLSKALRIPHHLFVLLAAEPQDLRTNTPEDLNQISQSLARFLLGHAQSGRARRGRRTVSR